ncbi:hypothetical protein EVAR_7696_1 [Eumeta japonica]|uniref:Uncharacterized protein n=1 Tax=Eumeta variegata TaxID=151549 RepID=A0A4C1TLF3_EUMVA|nr:hypothetical protein EVAR_7696_1 [Eumeta japonica]
MLAELRTLTVWASHPQERAEQRLPDQLVLYNFPKPILADLLGREVSGAGCRCVRVLNRAPFRRLRGCAKPSVTAGAPAPRTLLGLR